MPHQAVRFPAALCVSAVAALAWGAGTAAQGSAQNPPTGSAQGPAQDAGQATPPQRPVFRAGTNFVQVDAYPTRDGQIVEGLTAKDFQVFENGQPQAVESFEFVRIEPNTPDEERRDPQTQEEGLQLAADPRNRVFVLYLDHYFGSLEGSYYTRRPIVDMLNRMLSVSDLFAVATVHTRTRDLILGRRTTTIEDQLERHWTWGMQSGGSMDLEPEEQRMEACYGTDMAVAVARRTREERTLESLTRMVEYLGVIREARKAVVVFTRGWPLAEPDPGAVNMLLDRDKATRPRVGVTGYGQLSTTPPAGSGMADWAWCNAEIARVYTLDNRKRFQELLTAANRNNVTFYPVNPNGLTGAREDVLRTLADNTDGLTVMTNDIGSGLRRVADAVSAYYVLGYNATNAKQDGSYRRIEVKVSQPGVQVKARRGYLAASLDPQAERSGAAAGGSTPAPPEGLAMAMDVLSRLRPAAELFTFGVMTPAEVAVAAELSSQSLSMGPWARGADVTVVVTDAAGASVTGKGRIDAGLRSALVRVPRPAGSGPYTATVRLSTAGEDLTDRVEIAAPSNALTGAPLLFRAMPAGQSPLRPVADLQYRRTERAHIEWPILAPLDRRDARLLSKDGRPLAVPVTVTERDQNGTPVLAAHLNLAPLAAGDYVIELSVGAGDKTEQRFVAIRVRQ